MVCRAFLGFFFFFKKKCHESDFRSCATRYAVIAKSKVSIDDISQDELDSALVTLANSMPTFLWMAFQVLPRPGILENCRQEIMKIVTTKAKSDGTLLQNLDITNLRSKNIDFNVSRSDMSYDLRKFDKINDQGHSCEQQTLLGKKNVIVVLCEFHSERFRALGT